MIMYIETNRTEDGTQFINDGGDGREVIGRSLCFFNGRVEGHVDIYENKAIDFARHVRQEVLLFSNLEEVLSVMAEGEVAERWRMRSSSPLRPS